MAATIYECDIAIIGGGFGGVAAALAAAEAGCRVVMSEPTDWIGGQVTSQAVAPLDEHALMETFGGTRTYYHYRDGVRAWYCARYPAANLAPQPLNPGNGWVSRLCYEPRAGLAVLQAMLVPYVQDGRVRLLLIHRPTGVKVQNGHIREVTLAGPQGEKAGVRAAYYLDASELGDLLPLAGVPYVSGAEAASDTGEPHAAVDGAHPDRVQSFTVSMVVEYCPGENHTIARPAGYEYLRKAQPFSLELPQPGGGSRRFPMFSGEQSFWAYRRLFDAALLTPGAFAHPSHRKNDVALINWDGNDYYKENLIDRSPAQQARILREARRLSLSFLYWLQTEAPRDDGRGVGYPGLRLMPEGSGTTDGLAKAPYIRESRRILGLHRVLEQDMIPAPSVDGQNRGRRALHYSDTVGIGWYPIDLHRCAGDPPDALARREPFPPSLPFQIPLGALLTPAVDNLIASAKNIGTTHITSAAYRLQPVEWAIGEAAGALAAACVTGGVKPRAIWESPEALFAFQQSLLARGVPLLWTADVPLQDPDFKAVQTCLLRAAQRQDALFPPDSPRREHPEVLPDALLSRSEAIWLLERLPGAQGNDALQRLLERWRDAPLGPLSGQDWSLACWALDLPHPEGRYPSLREVSQRLVNCA